MSVDAIINEGAADEFRRRNANLEDENRSLAKMFAERKPIVEVRYYEPRETKPMPPREVKVRVMPDRIKVIVPAGIMLVDVPGPVRDRPAGFFGRLGDHIDRLFGLTEPNPCC